MRQMTCIIGEKIGQSSPNSASSKAWVPQLQNKMHILKSTWIWGFRGRRWIDISWASFIAATTCRNIDLKKVSYKVRKKNIWLTWSKGSMHCPSHWVLRPSGYWWGCSSAQTTTPSWSACKRLISNIHILKLYTWHSRSWALSSGLDWVHLRGHPGILLRAPRPPMQKMKDLWWSVKGCYNLVSPLEDQTLQSDLHLAVNISPITFSYLGGEILFESM